MEPVIDLGRFGDSGVGDEPPGPNRRRREVRGVALVAVLVLALLLGGASVPPESRFPFQTVKVGETSGFELVDGTLYVTDPAEGQVIAYSPAGRRLWHAQVHVPRLAGNVVSGGNVVLLGEEE